MYKYAGSYVSVHVGWHGRLQNRGFEGYEQVSGADIRVRV